MVSVTSGWHSHVSIHKNSPVLTEAVVEIHHICAKSTERHPPFSDASGPSIHRNHLLPNKLWQISQPDAVWHNICY
jgi:hypothetical protein